MEKNFHILYLVLYLSYELSDEFSACSILVVLCWYSFGRIGRIVCRIGIRNGLDFLAINDPFIEPDYMVGLITTIKATSRKYK